MKEVTPTHSKNAIITPSHIDSYYLYKDTRVRFQHLQKLTLSDSLRVFFVLLVLVPQIFTSVWAEATPKKTFNVEATSGFKPVQSALKALLEKQRVTNTRQHLCVIGYINDRDAGAAPTKMAWVHWREKNQLIYWGAAAKGFASKETLLRSRRTLDLSADVVPTDDDIGGSTYLVSKPWVEALLKDCKARGKSYAVSP
jgi:hypothetical protein